MTWSNLIDHDWPISLNVLINIRGSSFACRTHLVSLHDKARKRKTSSSWSTNCVKVQVRHALDMLDKVANDEAILIYSYLSRPLLDIHMAWPWLILIVELPWQAQVSFQASIERSLEGTVLPSSTIQIWELILDPGMHVHWYSQERMIIHNVYPPVQSNPWLTTSSLR